MGGFFNVIYYIQWNIIQPEKEKKDLQYAATWMNLDNSMSSEIS